MLLYVTDVKELIANRSTMYYRPNSGPEKSTSISSEDLNRVPQDYHIMNKAMGGTEVRILFDLQGAFPLFRFHVAERRKTHTRSIKCGGVLLCR